MKYYTKEWMELAQKLDYTSRFKTIPDKDYTDDEIQKLYLEEEKRYVKEEKEHYNEPPINFIEYLGIKNIEIDDVARIDEETGEMIHPSTKEEAMEWARADYEKELEIFEKRPPFNEDKAKQEFKEMYENTLEASFKEFQRFWNEAVGEKDLDVSLIVDKRILALDLMPKSIFQKLQAQDEKNEKRFNELEKIAKEIFKNQKIPAKVEDLFKGLHDGNLVSVGEKQGNIILKIFPEGSKNARIIKLIDAQITENELTQITNVENVSEEGVCFLYDELFHNKDGYEVHIMADVGVMELRYLTIKCEDIIKGAEEDLVIDAQ